MTAFQTLQQGIAAIRAGDYAGGGGLLQSALQDPTLKGRLRATALNWLAEISADPAQKSTYYEEALEVDPTNDWAEERLAALLQPTKTAPSSLNLPEHENPMIVPPPPAPVYAPPDKRPAPPPSLPEAPAAPPAAPGPSYKVVGILGGSNGPGSGFFLTATGILASTRYVIGAQDKVTVELEAGLQLPGQVLRSFPHLDVALIQIEYEVQGLTPETVSDHIQPNTPIHYLAYGKTQVSGQRRETGRRLPPHLFPTDIVPVPDAGGGPVFDTQGDLLGMLTRDISTSSSYVYGVHIAAIRRCLEIYNYELRSVAQRVYCTSCGYASAAVTAGGYYCETCGTLMTQGHSHPRGQTPHMAALYGENSAPACTVCGARVGFYDGLCLRCGQAGDPGGQRATPVDY